MRLGLQEDHAARERIDHAERRVERLGVRGDGGDRPFGSGVELRAERVQHRDVRRHAERSHLVVLQPQLADQRFGLRDEHDDR